MHSIFQNAQKPQNKQQNPPLPLLNPSKQPQTQQIPQPQPIEQVAELTLLKQQMLTEAIDFHSQLDRLQHQLIRKSNELEIFTSKEMDQISEKNIGLVREFIKYQQGLMRKLQGKATNWDNLELQLNEVEFRVERQMSERDFPVKLAKIQLLEEEIKSLMGQIEQLNRENERNRF